MNNLDKKLIAAISHYKVCGIEQQVDYEKFYLYSLITHSTAIEGSTVTEIENQLMFDQGIAATGRSTVEQMMNIDLKDAYIYGFEWIKHGLPYNKDILCAISAKVMRRTGTVYSTLAGNFDSSKGELRLCNVSAGVGGKSYITFNKVPDAIDNFCKWLNNELAKVDRSDVAACYRLSFNAHYRLVTIHPWVDGNGRTSRLLMNMIQRQLGLIPSIVSSEEKAKYIKALIDTRETGNIHTFEDEMISQHITNIENRTSQYIKSLDDTINHHDDTINHHDDTINDTIATRRKELLKLVKLNPGITRISLAESLGVSVPTIARDIAYLIDMQLIERVGSKKAGYRSIG